MKCAHSIKIAMLQKIGVKKIELSYFIFRKNKKQNIVASCNLLVYFKIGFILVDTNFSHVSCFSAHNLVRGMFLFLFLGFQTL